MSIESDTEFFEVIKIGAVYDRKHYSLYNETYNKTYNETYNETGFFYGGMEYAGRKSFSGLNDDCDFDDVSKAADAAGDELIEFVGDVDFDDNFGDNFGDNDFSSSAKMSGTDIGSPLQYDYEMDVADAQNLDEQIKSYVADLWELVSIIGDRILFRRPKITGF
ncbi:MAG: hypothetical protein FWE78_05060 [Methanimicrococcus sp.]|nr:hypothetical protein [Methanimicrococcus sp.]